VGSLRRRLRTLEARRKGSPGPAITEEELRSLSEERLDALEDSLEQGLEQSAGNFWDLYRAVVERSRRALVALIETHEAVRRGEDPPTRDPPADSSYALIERMAAGDAEARQEWEKRNGYRIWKYYRK
jgi:hypothetical protein